MDDYRRLVHSFKLPKTYVKEALFDLYWNYVMGHPQAPAADVILTFKDKVTGLLNEEGRMQMTLNEAKSRERLCWEEMPVDEFIVLVDRLAVTSNTHHLSGGK